MKLLSIAGARPQFIKVAVIAAALQTRVDADSIEHRILHTGQHYDAKMSDCFFRELSIPAPTYNLGVGSGSHGRQTGEMLAGIESALLEYRPDAAIVYGDTNSTTAGALASAKLNIPVVHVEAGLRSFNRRMPEELNRVIADHLADLLLCPTGMALENARQEGLEARCALTGDIMLDLLMHNAPGLQRHPLATEPYALITLHRAENTDTPARLEEFITILEQLPLKAVLPMHPRLRHRLSADHMNRLERLGHLRIVGPCEYLEMLSLERDARMILTDSGGVQKEAYFLGVPCLTLRDETEWQETLTGGWNRVVGMDSSRVLEISQSLLNRNGYLPSGAPDLAQFGGGNAATASVNAIVTCLEGVMG